MTPTEDPIERVFEKIDALNEKMADHAKDATTTASDQRIEIAKLSIRQKQIEDTLCGIRTALRWLGSAAAIVGVGAVANFVLRGGLMP